MTSLALSTDTARRVGQLLRLLASDKDGEVIGAARAIQRVLGAAGADLHVLGDVVERGLAPVPPPPSSPPAPPRPTQSTVILARRCAGQSWRLTPKERGFIDSMETWHGAPTEKQRAWLFAIARRLGVA
jgi:hypothetical protein